MEMKPRFWKYAGRWSVEWQNETPPELVAEARAHLREMAWHDEKTALQAWIKSAGFGELADEIVAAYKADPVYVGQVWRSLCPSSP